MVTNTMSASGATTSSASATLSVRYSFAPQYIAGAVALVERARVLEATDPNPAMQVEYRALVVGAVSQAVAAIEADLGEVCMYGVRGHSSHNSAAITASMAAILRQRDDVVDRWNNALGCLGVPTLNTGRAPSQDTKLLINVRNELTHYQSRLNGATLRNVQTQLRGKKFTRPHFVAQHRGGLEWPLGTLCVSLAEWACSTAAAYLDAIYAQIGAQSVLHDARKPGADHEPFMTQLARY